MPYAHPSMAPHVSHTQLTPRSPRAESVCPSCTRAASYHHDASMQEGHPADPRPMSAPPSQPPLSQQAQALPPQPPQQHKAPAPASSAAGLRSSGRSFFQAMSAAVASTTRAAAAAGASAVAAGCLCCKRCQSHARGSSHLCAKIHVCACAVHSLTGDASLQPQADKAGGTVLKPALSGCEASANIRTLSLCFPTSKHSHAQECTLIIAACAQGLSQNTGSPRPQPLHVHRGRHRRHAPHRCAHALRCVKAAGDLPHHPLPVLGRCNGRGGRGAARAGSALVRLCKFWRLCVHACCVAQQRLIQGCSVSCIGVGHTAWPGALCKTPRLARPHGLHNPEYSNPCITYNPCINPYNSCIA